MQRQKFQRLRKKTRERSRDERKREKKNGLRIPY